MDKKGPIPFKDKQRERRQKRQAQKPTNRYAPPARMRAGGTSGGELDDVRTYWSRWLHQPFQSPGRLLWTDRMFWGNALLTGIVTAIVAAIRTGFAPLTIFSAGINAFFVFFLAYYLFSWVSFWVLSRIGERQASVDALKLEMIVLSGWLSLVLLLRLIPWFQPFLFELPLVGFAVLTLLAVRRATRSSWVHAIGGTIAGLLAVVIVQVILSTL